jgi:murein DD-endopeptidase MepM/ murein hydrolase activator NlpD
MNFIFTKSLIRIVSLLSLFLCLTGLLSNFSGEAYLVAFAQEGEPDKPIYIVQEGDSLWDIAVRFGVSIEELSHENSISDLSQLAIGDRLVIPGLEGIEGVLTTITISYGETLQSISRMFQVPVDYLIRLNRLTRPSELFVGSSLIIPEKNLTTSETTRSVILPEISLFELAIATNSNPWDYIIKNDLTGNWSAVPGDVLHTFASSSDTTNDLGENPAEPGALPETIINAKVIPLTIDQGKVSVIKINSNSELSLSGSFLGHELHFFENGKNEYVSLQGVHAMTEPGLYNLYLTGQLPEGAPYRGAQFSFSQPILVRSGSYPFDPVLIVSPETIDPAVTRPEDAQWEALATPFTAEKYWQGQFVSPAPPPYSECWPSMFGNRRSYNGSAYDYFHTGLDFCGGVGTEIIAPAKGKVVFAGPLTVRGNATIIDHGWGIYSAYMHQSEILVKPGDMVKPGQVIGLVGGTGRVTGPHLHWEVWAGGVQVDPFDWLKLTFP